MDAPVDMMLTEVDWKLSYAEQTLSLPFYFRGLLLNSSQLDSLMD